MILFLLILVTNILVSNSVTTKDRIHHNRINTRNITDLITKYGYNQEIHTVTTEDGYILETFRLCKGSCNGKITVFLQHGVFNTAEHFLIFGPGRSLGFILADNNCDVWLGNSRGTKFSRKHKTLNPDVDAQFWKFSFHEMGYYDLPANIDYILNVTGKKQLYYVGHSQGTSSYYVMGSTRPEYNAKVRAHFSLSCVAHMKTIKNPPFQLLAANLGIEQAVEAIFQNDPFFYDFNIPLTLTSIIGELFCSDISPAQVFCKELLVEYAGFSNEELNATTIPTILSYTPAEGSIRQVIHYLQLIRSGYFRPYDYGLIENLKRYKLPTPPSYNLGKISSDVYLFLGQNDFFANLNEVLTKTVVQIGNVKGKYVIPIPTFAHNDFVLGIDVKTQIYNRIICIISNYETGSNKNCL